LAWVLIFFPKALHSPGFDHTPLKLSMRRRGLGGVRLYRPAPFCEPLTSAFAQKRAAGMDSETHIRCALLTGQKLALNCHPAWQHTLSSADVNG
jgi:hypothetical protein